MQRVPTEICPIVNVKAIQEESTNMSAESKHVKIEVFRSPSCGVGGINFSPIRTTILFAQSTAFETDPEQVGAYYSTRIMLGREDKKASLYSKAS